MKTLPSFIKNSLENPIDYTPAFTDKVEKLKNSLLNIFHLPIKHIEGMDYASAQFLSFDIDEKNFKNIPKKYLFEVRIYISSKSSLFAIYIFDKKRNIVNHDELEHPIEVSRLPSTAQEVVISVREFLKSEAYVEVEHQWFRVDAPNCKTQLDDLPASIFEALFAEIV